MSKVAVSDEDKEDILWDSVETILRPSRSSSGKVMHIPEEEGSPYSLCPYKTNTFTRWPRESVPKGYAGWRWCEWCKEEYFEDGEATA